MDTGRPCQAGGVCQPVRFVSSVQFTLKGCFYLAWDLSIMMSEWDFEKVIKEVLDRWCNTVLIDTGENKAGNRAGTFASHHSFCTGFEPAVPCRLCGCWTSPLCSKVRVCWIFSNSYVTQTLSSCFEMLFFSAVYTQQIMHGRQPSWQERFPLTFSDIDVEKVEGNKYGHCCCCVQRKANLERLVELERWIRKALVLLVCLSPSPVLFHINNFMVHAAKLDLEYVLLYLVGLNLLWSGEPVVAMRRALAGSALVE